MAVSLASTARSCIHSRRRLHLNKHCGESTRKMSPVDSDKDVVGNHNVLVERPGCSPAALVLCVFYSEEFLL